LFNKLYYLLLICF